MTDHYTTSWELYKAHTESFTDDFDYYAAFCGSYHTLELFAGYGRLTNRLLEQGSSLETVEINYQFAACINLPQHLNHVADLLEFSTEKKYQRIFAAYNSFCLFTKEDDIQRFFNCINHWLAPGGKASLNYYHQDFWASAVNEEINVDGEIVRYIPDFDLSQRTKNKTGMWIDHYDSGTHRETHEYTTRIYESSDDLQPYLKNTELEVVGVIENFGKTKEEILEPGWIDFILQKHY